MAKPKSFNGKEMAFVIVETALGRAVLAPVDLKDRELLKGHVGRVVVLTMINPLDKITKSCGNCSVKKRGDCAPSNGYRAGEEGYYKAADCERWDNERRDSKTVVWETRPVVCQKCGTRKLKIKDTGESYCPRCEPKNKQKGAE